MILTNENYFSKEADLEYMSVSQYKAFKECSSKALAVINSESDATSKEAYLEGHLFETIIAGDIDLFVIQHPEMISTRGATAGEFKANYKKVVKAANRIKQQDFVMDIVNKCDKQVIMTGVINGVKIKCCADLLDKETGNIYDFKCMANFDKKWNDEQRCYMDWYYYYGYVLQMAVYQEIARQNFGELFNTHLIAATKEDEPNMDAIHLDNELLKLELEEFSNNIVYFDKIKKGLEIPIACGNCDYCKAHKEITEFREVK